MKRSDEAKTLDDVLLDFMLVQRIPDMDIVEEFQERYPQFADDILESAARTAEYYLSGDASRTFENEPGDEEFARLFVELCKRPVRLN